MDDDPAGFDASWLRHSGNYTTYAGIMREVLAAIALESGLVDFVTTGDQLMAEAEATAKQLAAGATLAYGGIKQTMFKARHQGVESQMEDEAQTLATLSRSDDAWEGLSAFLEKRSPRFKGK